MTITRPATATTYLHPHPFQALRQWADASLATIRGPRCTSRRPTPTPAFAPPLTVWQIDRHELGSTLEHGRW
jgi:hypothetical protein